MRAALPTPRAEGARRAAAGRVVLVALCALAMAASLAAAQDRAAGLAAAALVPVLAAIAVTDARWYLIPDSLNAAGFALGLAHAAAAAADPLEGGLLALVRGVALALLFLALRLGYRAVRGRDGLGLGDVKLAGVAGAWLEVEAIPVAIEIAALAALLAYGLEHFRAKRMPVRVKKMLSRNSSEHFPDSVKRGNALARGRSGTRHLRPRGLDRLPFGLFFAPAIWIGWILERWILAPW